MLSHRDIHFFPILGVKCPYQTKFFNAVEKQSSKKGARCEKAFNDQAGGFSGPKMVFGLGRDALMCT
jgi:hypothetical protein